MFADVNWINVMIIVGAFVVAFGIAFRTIPTVNYIARTKGLLNSPNNRTSHRYSTPNLGGVSIYGAITVAIFLFADGTTISEFKFIYLALFAVFTIGLKDDILILSPEKKLLFQFIAALLVVYSDLRFTNLHNLFSIGDLNQITSAVITICCLIVIMNAVNLMDGIDGLCALVGAITLTTFGGWFWMNGEIGWTIICASFIGALMAFFGFNVFGLRNKTFMGDCGSLVVGLLLACVVIKFNEMNVGIAYPFTMKSSPAVSFGVMIIPLFDTMRVFFIRLLKKTSPFTADRNHIHHRIIDLGFTHLQATIILGLVNILFIAISFSLRNWGTLRLGGLLLVLATLLSLIPEIILRKKKIVPNSNNNKGLY